MPLSPTPSVGLKKKKRTAVPAVSEREGTQFQELECPSSEKDPAATGPGPMHTYDLNMRIT